MRNVQILILEHIMLDVWHSWEGMRDASHSVALLL